MNEMHTFIYGFYKYRVLLFLCVCNTNKHVNGFKLLLFLLST